MNPRRRATAVLLAFALFMGLPAPASGMTGAGHAIGGAALSQLTSSEAGAFWTGFASHALLDAVPHAEWHLATQTVLFLAAAHAIHAEYQRTGDRRLLWGAVGGVLPDLEHLFYRLGWIDREYYPSHNGSVPHGRADKWAGFWIEAGVTGLMVGLAF